MVIYLVCSLFIGLLFVALGIPLAKGKVRPNNFYGLRVWQTLDNEIVWYKANRFMGREMVIFGGCTLLLTMGLAPFLWSNPDAFGLLLSFFVVVGALVFAIRGLREAGKIFQRVTKEEKPVAGVENA